MFACLCINSLHYTCQYNFIYLCVSNVLGSTDLNKLQCTIRAVDRVGSSKLQAKQIRTYKTFGKSIKHCFVWCETAEHYKTCVVCTLPCTNMPQVYMYMYAQDNRHSQTHPPTHIHVHTHIHIHTPTCTDIHTPTPTQTHTYTQAHTPIHTCTHTCPHTQTHTHTHTHPYTHAHTHAHTLKHIHTHTHTQTHTYIHTCTHTYTHTCPHTLKHIHTHYSIHAEAYSKGGSVGQQLLVSGLRCFVLLLPLLGQFPFGLDRSTYAIKFQH